MRQPLVLREVRPERGREPQVADEMDVDDVAKDLRLVLLVPDQAAGAVDQHVQRIDLVRERLDGRIVAHIEGLERKALVGGRRLDIAEGDVALRRREMRGRRPCRCRRCRR